MLGLDFAPANSALKADLNLARVVGGRSRKPSKTVNVPPHHSSTETAEPSFGKSENVCSTRRALLIVQNCLRCGLAQF